MSKAHETTWRSVLKPLASLRLTVALFVLAMFLIFAGTLAQTSKGNWAVVNEYFRPWGWPPTKFFVWIPFQIFVPESLLKIGGGFPFPGGFLIGGLLLVNLLCAHALRFQIKARGAQLAWGVLGTLTAVALITAAATVPALVEQFWPRMIASTAGLLLLIPASFMLYARRTGVVLLHAGIVLMLVGEAVTAVAAREANMTIEEGTSVNYTEDTREVELAVIDPSDPELDHVVAFPHALLARSAAEGKVISHPKVPFHIRVERFMPNSQVFGPFQARQQGITDKPLADMGVGAGAVAREVPVVSGVESQVIDVPTAFVTLTHGPRRLGTWMVSLYIDGPQVVEFDGQHRLIELRFRRQYKPYTMHLLEFRHDKFVGTETPRNFSSRVRLIDPTQNEDREVLIWMNHPLRYGGETFFQSGFKPGDTTTILQVVRNPGWLLPYLSCAIVAIGMTAHFGVTLLGFLRRTTL